MKKKLNFRKREKLIQSFSKKSLKKNLKTDPVLFHYTCFHQTRSGYENQKIKLQNILEVEKTIINRNFMPYTNYRATFNYSETV